MPAALGRDAMWLDEMVSWHCGWHEVVICGGGVREWDPVQRHRERQSLHFTIIKQAGMFSGEPQSRGSRMGRSLLL